MRVVGGKLDPDKKLGTYVSTVVPAGIADIAGIVEGQFSINQSVWDGTVVLYKLYFAWDNKL